MTHTAVNKALSPFHSGEQAIQSRLGVRDKMERFGRQVIRDFMPQQHQEFYSQLPFIFVGHADENGWPWASILFNQPGFITSKDEYSLSIKSNPVTGDPLQDSLKKGTRLGLLGIELPTRRRNRLSAHIESVSTQSFELNVDQAFGNCPQYIQSREIEYLDQDARQACEVDEITQLDNELQDLIASSDTFFVASYVANGSGEASEGADISHRGGRPGFIRVDDEKNLTIPDYLGNNHYNTLGNFAVNNKAGLLFIDFENGHLFTLTGTVEILWDSTDIKHFEGAERLWKFRLDHGRKLKHALPFRWKFNNFSPNSTLTGTWQEVKAIKESTELKDTWQPYKVERIVQESSMIKSFYLSPQGHQALKFTPGQFLTVKADIKNTSETENRIESHIRTYTLSSAPADDIYRISVKKESSTDTSMPAGIVSNYLHSEVKERDTLYAKAPTGEFKYDSESERPVILLAGGIGITPMISILRHALIEGLRTRKMKPIIFIGAAQDHKQRAFYSEIQQICDASQGQIKAYWALSKADPDLNAGPDLKAGRDFQHTGRISRELLQSILPMDDYDCYLCGPAGFMQSNYDLLISLGVNDARIHAEAFGPASLIRNNSQGTQEFQNESMAEQAIIEFSVSGIEQAWTKEDGNLLEFAEAHGLQPEFGCRSGQCGACKVPLNSGAVSYNSKYSADVKDNEVLLCCAVPAANEGNVAKVSLTM